jgi:hypothetical protein
MRFAVVLCLTLSALSSASSVPILRNPSLAAAAPRRAQVSCGVALVALADCVNGRLDNDPTFCTNCVGPSSPYEAMLVACDAQGMNLYNAFLAAMDADPFLLNADQVKSVFGVLKTCPRRLSSLSLVFSVHILLKLSQCI